MIDMMPPYPVYCSEKDCKRLATYKIAARWSDGATEELKTYAVCCGECLPAVLQRSRERNAACRRAGGETLDPPGVYRLTRGRRDAQLERCLDLE